jgi:hypothetical protein
VNDPAAILRTLQAIEQDLAERQNDFSQAAGNRARLVREVEYEQALAFAKAPGNTTEKRERSKVAVGGSQAYKDLTAAEATYDACKAAVGVLETRASIGQTLLRTLREAA